MDTTRINRREFLELTGLVGAGIAGVVFASGLRQANAVERRARENDFFFLQMSDTHWGFSGPAVNPDATVTLKKAVATVNGLRPQPDFIVFTGDLTHTTDDPQERRMRMRQFREIVSNLKVKTIHFLAGEHDASLDHGEAFRESFGDLHYTFDHKGVHFIVLDNVSDPTGSLGNAQLQWLQGDLARLDREQSIAVLTHRPLFDLFPQWDWATRDGDAAVQALMPYTHVTVFYGHIHQEHHHLTGHIPHYSAKSLMFPLPAPGSVPKKAPIPWNPARPYEGLGFRTAQTKAGGTEYSLTEWPVVRG